MTPEEVLDGPHNHSVESVGKIMTTKVPTISPNASIGDVEHLLMQRAGDFESINYVYVVDGAGKLVGALSIKEVFRQKKEILVSAVMRKNTVAARPHAHQERVGYLALEHNIKAVPVTTKDGIFLGAVMSDKILTILHKELSEDLLQLAGIRKAESQYDNVVQIPIMTSLRHRLPWLLLGLLGGVLIAGIIKHFDHVLEQHLILASFVPLIVYMASAVAMQMSAFVIRDLALKPQLNFFKYALRNLFVVCLIGLIGAGVLFGVSQILGTSVWVGIVLALSLFVGVLTSVVTGLFIPYIFGHLKQDPANASGPVATIVQDALSVVVYFSVASWLL